MSRNAGVLTMTDLRPDSEQALVLAGRIAERCGLVLDVLYALGVRGLFQLVPELQELDKRITSIDRSIRALIRAHFPHWDRAPGPVIDVDNGPVALLRRAAQLQPRIVVLPLSLNEVRDGDQPRDFAAAATLSAPVLLVNSTSASCGERAVLIAPAATPPHAFVRFAREWVRWLEAVGNSPLFPRELSLDVVAVEDASGLKAGFITHEPSLILIPKSAMDEPRGGAMRAAVASLLAQHRSHVLIMPDSTPPPLRAESELDLSLAAAGA